MGKSRAAYRRKHGIVQYSSPATPDLDRLPYEEAVALALAGYDVDRAKTIRQQDMRLVEALSETPSKRTERIAPSVLGYSTTPLKPCHKSELVPKDKLVNYIPSDRKGGGKSKLEGGYRKRHGPDAGQRVSMYRTTGVSFTSGGFRAPTGAASGHILEVSFDSEGQATVEKDVNYVRNREAGTAWGYLKMRMRRELRDGNEASARALCKANAWNQQALDEVLAADARKEAKKEARKAMRLARKATRKGALPVEEKGEEKGEEKAKVIVTRPLRTSAAGLTVTPANSCKYISIAKHDADFVVGDDVW